jgi:hypothetical protein
MEQLEAWREVELFIGEYMEEYGVSFYDEDFVACIVADEVDGSGTQVVVPGSVSTIGLGAGFLAR